MEMPTNNRRNTIWLEIDGKKVSATQAAVMFNMSYGTLKTRLRRGIPVGTPVKFRKNKAVVNE